jgi:hypothetical protein
VDIDGIRQPSPSESEGRIGFLGVFASPAIESAFRQRHFRDEVWLCRFLVVAAMLRVALLVLADYQHFELGPAFWPLLASRLLFLLVSVLVLLALRQSSSPATAERLFFGWCFLLAALTVSVLSARPPDNNGLLLMSFGMVLIAYCVTPLTLSRQAIVALAYSAAVLYVARRADGETLAVVFVVHTMGNLFGIVASWRLNHRRRERFLGSLREAELRANLEEAMACICAWCKRIRDEEESWQSVEAYVQSRTHASFTHGICPDCLRSQVGDIARLSSKEEAHYRAERLTAPSAS